MERGEPLFDANLAPVLPDPSLVRTGGLILSRAASRRAITSCTAVLSFLSGKRETDAKTTFSVNSTDLAFSSFTSPVSRAAVASEMYPSAIGAGAGLASADASLDPLSRTRT